MAGESRIVVRPDRRRLHGFFGSVFPGTDYVFETEGGEEVGRLHLHLTRPNEFVGRAKGAPLTLTREGVLVPRFEARRADGSLVAAVEYAFVSGAMELVLADGTRRPIERDGLVLPTFRLADALGVPVLEVETWRLYGKEFHVTVRPNERWREETLLAVAALVFHVRASLSIVFSAAASAGVLAPAKVRT